MKHIKCVRVIIFENSESNFFSIDVYIWNILSVKHSQNRMSLVECWRKCNIYFNCTNYKYLLTPFKLLQNITYVLHLKILVIHKSQKNPCSDSLTRHCTLLNNRVIIVVLNDVRHNQKLFLKLSNWIPSKTCQQEDILSLIASFRYGRLMRIVFTTYIMWKIIISSVVYVTM